MIKVLIKKVESKNGSKFVGQVGSVQCNIVYNKSKDKYWLNVESLNLDNRKWFTIPNDQMMDGNIVNFDENKVGRTNLDVHSTKKNSFKVLDWLNEDDQKTYTSLIEKAEKAWQADLEKKEEEEKKARVNSAVETIKGLGLTKEQLEALLK